MRLIILPQALRLVIPALVGQAISLFKDTSLVAIVGLFDLLRIAQVVVAQPDWLGLQRETYAFVALIYWIFAFAMSRASQRLERRLGVGKY
jgi:general L-amino acid transport system permease protein